jgi:hypothetical protein
VVDAQRAGGANQTRRDGGNDVNDPKPAVSNRSKRRSYSITSSARAQQPDKVPDRISLFAAAGDSTYSTLIEAFRLAPNRVRFVLLH